MQNPKKTLRLPPEILTIVIAELLPPAFKYERANWLSREPEAETFNSSSALYRICLTNRLWYSVGVQMLYQRVILSTLPQLQQFHKTLSQNPSLQKLVRELVIFDAVRGPGFWTPKSISHRSIYYRVVMKRVYRARANRMRKQAVSILSLCSRLQRISLHLCAASWRGYSLTPNILNSNVDTESGIHTPALRSLLITAVPPSSHFLNSQALSLSKLETLTLFEMDIPISFLENIPSGLPLLHSLTLVHVYIHHDYRGDRYTLFRGMCSLKTLHLIDTGLDPPDMLLENAQVKACPCPANLERLSLVSSMFELDNLLSEWSQLGAFSESLQELAIPLFDSPLPSIKLPSSLTKLVIFFDTFCYHDNKYIPLITKVRTLLEQNDAVLNSGSLKSLTLVVAPSSAHPSFDNWMSPYLIREERLLRELCHSHDIRLYRTTVANKWHWFLNEAEGDTILAESVLI